MRNSKKSTQAKANTKAEKAAAATTTKPEAAAPEAEKAVIVVKHSFKPTVINGGAQNTINRANSRTRIQAELFDTEPNLIFTPLQNVFMRDIKAQFGDGEFKRLDLNAGKLNRAIRAGHIQPVSGDYAGRECTFKLTKKALDTKY